MRGDLRLKMKVGSGAPAGEITHEGTGNVVVIKLNGSAGKRRHSVTLVLTDRDNGNLEVITNCHGDISKNVVVYYDSSCTCLIGELNLLLEGDIATAYESDLAVYVNAGVVYGVSVSRNGNVLYNLVGVRLGDSEHLEEVVLLRILVVCLLEEYLKVTVCIHILVLDTVDRCYGK